MYDVKKAIKPKVTDKADTGTLEAINIIISATGWPLLVISHFEVQDIDMSFEFRFCILCA